MKLSVILPSRNEFPNVVHTFYSIVHALKVEGFSVQDYEIIIVNNCSNDEKYPQRGTGGTTDYLSTRGAYYNRVIRILYDPIAGNHSARNKGARIARGDYLFMSDAHMAYEPGFFTKMMKAVDESGGLAHGALQFMGAYPPVDSSNGYGYTIKLGDEIRGTWNNYLIGDGKSWFYIPAQGHWGLMAKRKQFLDFGGYPDVHRTYGGGEFFTDFLWWSLGSVVVTVPDAIGYHLASGRGYTYHHDDYKENVLGISYALGMDSWRERTYLNYLRKGRKEILDLMMERSEREHQPRRIQIEKRRKHTIDELLVERPWEKLNIEKFGHGLPGLQLFHWSWLELMKEAPPYVQEAYLKSKYQQQLGEFIETKLKDFIYKGKQYQEKYGEETLRGWRKELQTSEGKVKAEVIPADAEE